MSEFKFDRYPTSEELKNLSAEDYRQWSLVMDVIFALNQAMTDGNNQLMDYQARLDWFERVIGKKVDKGLFANNLEIALNKLPKMEGEIADRRNEIRNALKNVVKK